MIEDLIGGTLPFLPSKKTIAAKKKLSLLRKQEWFRTAYGMEIPYNNRIKEFIVSFDLEYVLNDTNEIRLFRQRLDELLKEERLS
ncbi:hypothetical protein [Priestia megaterium]|uniref:hypothetical protein n=1 Tax=Priestia megaterium TaxID=1404 RepID=UPI000D51F4C8|nr:hypothetical protein [Priestia megaterium]PVE71226.1 hypothetical protein DC428_12385 [Priestia megaterium]PVE89281.1 hypothetical protein DC421_04230 [Priestia megaterium]PVE92971.1 hypothetical protein DC426_05885 [Priestia megaterium]PVE96235.1 hypothetical protein DC433_21330 [Priestia megaterium]